MALDLKSMDKKKLSVIVMAVVAGFIAVGLTNDYINRNVNERAGAISGAFEASISSALMPRHFHSWHSWHSISLAEKVHNYLPSF